MNDAGNGLLLADGRFRVFVMNELLFKALIQEAMCRAVVASSKWSDPPYSEHIFGIVITYLGMMLWVAEQVIYTGDVIDPSQVAEEEIELRNMSAHCVYHALRTVYPANSVQSYDLNKVRSSGRQMPRTVFGEICEIVNDEFRRAVSLTKMFGCPGCVTMLKTGIHDMNATQPEVDWFPENVCTDPDFKV